MKLPSAQGIRNQPAVRKSKAQQPKSAGHSRRPLIVGVTIALVAGLLVVLAVNAEGYPATDVKLSDSTVWVTNDAKGVVGRINRQIDELNSSVKANQPSDVLQDGDSVLVVDTAKKELRPVDVASVALTGRIGIPESAGVSLGGGVLGIVDTASGAVWAGTQDSLTGLDPVTTAPLLTSAAGATVATSASGTVFVVAPGRDELWSIPVAGNGQPTGWSVDDKGQPVGPEPARLTGGALSAQPAGAVSAGPGQVSVTTVGDTPVVLDRGSGELILTDHRVAIPDGGQAVLQQPGPASDTVLVSTPTGLFKVPLSGGAPDAVVQGVSGSPNAPVLLNGCVHAAWAAVTSSYAVACGSDPARTIDIPSAGQAPVLTFRVNRHVIVLNDNATGNVWLVDADMKLISNWDDVQPQEGSTENSDTGTGQPSPDEVNNSRQDCVAAAPEAKAPEAAADEFGVRAGRTTVLPVLDNDSSADCSMVVITSVTAPPSDVGTVTIAQSGQALQVAVAAEASGPLAAVTYTADDGLGRQSTAQVTITIAGPDDKRAPAKIRDSATLVEVGGTVSYNVLPDFRSPVGDDLSLVAAATTTDDSVTFQPNGMITFRDTGSAGAVKKTVNFTISDGSTPLPGALVVDVKPEGSTTPAPAPVHAAAVVNESTTAYPLRSVVSGSRDPVKVTALEPITPGSTATATLDPVDSSVALTAAAAGTSYFLYTVVAGSQSAAGVLRFDVSDPPSTPAPPDVSPDVGYLIPGRTLVIDPLANDRDPMGAVLAVQQLSQPPDSPLTATVRDLALVQVSSARSVPGGGITLTYTASNAVGGSTGQIRVIPVPAPSTPQPPVATDIAVTVRAGDAITIPINRYATDPSGELLTVKPFAADAALPAEQGLVFATDSAIRYLAPATPPGTTVRFSYTVVNTDLLADTRTVTVSVTPANPAVNSAPSSPGEVTARVFAGRTAAIALPLDGLDPDGDWVTYAGQTDPAPTAGRVDRAGAGAVTYTALGTPGLDRFGYLAADAFGLRVNGSVRVAVIAPPAVAEPPVAPDLSVVVRPGRTVAIDVLGSASDPGGNTPFTLADPALVLPVGISADLVDDAVVVPAPDTEGVFPIKYTVLNAKGLAASGILTVTVSATAPLAPPTAKDVFVEGTVVAADGASASVDVSSAVTNRSGQVTDLTVAMDSSAGSAATVDGRTITVAVTGARQVLAYQVTNLDGDSAKAFIVVPPSSELVLPQQQDQQQLEAAAPPQPKANVPPFTINAGETATVPVRDFVEIDGGRTAQVPAGASMNTTQGTVQRLDESSVQYSVPATASGNAVINVQVSDGIGTAVFIPIPVLILNPDPPPPVFTGASMTVEAGASASQQLSGLVSTANDDQRRALVFRGPTGLDGGLFGTLDGSILTVTADTSAPRGRSSTATISVGDGISTVSGTIAVTIVGSNATLATVPANRQVEATAGQPLSIPVLDGAYNPFPDIPLTIFSASTSNGVEAQVSQSTISVTPPVGVLDQFTVSFAVNDATGDLARQVQGTVTVIPVAKPEAPTSVVATSLGKPDSVNVAWRAPTLVRPEITAYTVYWNGGSLACPAGAGDCAVGPLTPGTPYTFAVSATNTQGEGPRSEPSASITPDVEPDIPAAPQAVWAAPGTVTVSWQQPNNTGSAIAGYTLTSNTGEVRTVSAGDLSVNWTGLRTTTQVSFTVAATNATGKTSQTSAASNALYPSDTTVAPDQPTLSADKDAGGTRTINVSWNEPARRGDPAESYVVTVNGTAATVSAPTTNYVIKNVQDGVQYAVSVKAVNHVGSSEASAAASTVTNPDEANVKSAVPVDPNGNRPQVKVTVEPSSTAGGTITSFDIYANGSKVGSGGSVQTVPVGSIGAYSFTARACVNNGACSTDDGASVSANAYGPVVVTNPAQTDQSQTAVRFRWTVPDSNGRGPMQTRYSIDGGGWSGWTTDPTVVVGDACGQSHTIKVQGSDSQGLLSPESGTVTGSSASCPPPTVVVSKYGNAVGQGSGAEQCIHSSCQFIRFDVAHFNPGSDVTCSPSYDGVTPKTIRVGADGSGGANALWWFGYPGRVVTVTCSGGGKSGSGSITW